MRLALNSDDAVVYVDPYKVPDDAHDADLIVITHSHGDHYSPEDIERVRKEDTCFATTAEVARLLERDFGIDDDYISELSFEAPRIGFECGAVLEPVAAENKNHPVSFGFGLVLEFAGFTYYLLRRHRRPGGQCPMRRAVCGVRRHLEHAGL